MMGYLLPLVLTGGLTSAYMFLPSDYYWGKDSGWFWTLIQTIILLVTLLFVYFQIRANRYLHMFETVAQLRASWNSSKLMICRYKACSEHGDAKGDLSYYETYVANFLEDLGFLLYRKAIDFECIWEGYSSCIQCYWVMLNKKIERYRGSENDRTYYDKFELMHSRCQKYAKKCGLQYGEVSEESLNKFIECEKGMIEIWQEDGQLNDEKALCD